MGLASGMLTNSTTSRGPIQDYIQFDILRKLRLTFTKVYEYSPAGIGEGSSFAKGTGWVCPTFCHNQSEWMQYMLRGTEYQVGYDTKVDHGVPIDVVVQLLEMVKACNNLVEANV